VAGIVTLLSGATNLYLAGSAIVRDGDASVPDVILRGGDREIAARRLPGGVYITTARLEGEAVVRCRNGKEISLGYITSAWHIRQTVRASNCRPSAPAVINS
jgi:hypothetical protein